MKSFKKIFNELVVIPIPNEPNSTDPIKLKNIANKLGYKAKVATNIFSAIKKISSNSKKTIVVFGSLYLIGNILKEN